MFTDGRFSSMIFARSHRKVSALHPADVLTEPALVAGCLIRVNQALAGGAVDHRYSRFVGGFRLSLVTRRDRFHHPLDVGTHRGTDAGIMLAMFFRLPGALFRLRRISQGLCPAIWLLSICSRPQAGCYSKNINILPI